MCFASPCPPQLCTSLLSPHFSVTTPSGIYVFLICAVERNKHSRDTIDLGPEEFCARKTAWRLGCSRFKRQPPSPHSSARTQHRQPGSRSALIGDQRPRMGCAETLYFLYVSKRHAARESRGISDFVHHNRYRDSVPTGKERPERNLAGLLLTTFGR